MSKFQKKSHTVEAVQWNQPGDHPAVQTRSFLGGQQILPGDWIVTHANGSVEVIKPDAFAKQYEPTPDPKPNAPIPEPKV